MKKLRLFVVTLSLLLIGGSTAIMISSIQSRYFLSSENEVYQAIPPLKGESSPVKESTIPSTPMIPSFSVQDFPEPTVEVFQFSDHEMDLRGYGDDTVRFNMKFRSTTERARFYGYAQLWTTDQITSLSREAYWEAWVDPNTNITASFDISGYEIHENGIDGPYSVRLRFYKDNDTTTTIYNSAFVHTTQSYLYTDFQARPTIDSITSNLIDQEPNGLYEWINVHVTVTVTIPDEYYFSGEITGGGVFEDARNDTYLAVGQHTVILKFAAWDFQGMSSAAITLTNLHIEHDTNPRYIVYSANPSVNIGTYGPSDFDTPPLDLTGRFWGYGYDTDGNSLFNYYRVIIEVELLRIEEGDFYLNPDIYKPPSDYIHGSSTNWVSFDSTGLVNVTVDFNGIEIYKSGITNDNLIIKDINGWFYHRPDIGYNWNDGFSFSNEFITSDTYDFTEFEGPGAYLTHNFNDYGQDTDEDTLFNIVILEVEVNVSVAGDYYIGGSIEHTSSSQDISDASTTVYLSVGIHWVSLQYDGVDFFLWAVNEVVKVAYISLEGGSPQTTLDYNNTALLSHYLFTDFDPPKARFTGIYSDTVADTNSDGLWDELRISVEVEINATGRYRVYGNLRNQMTDQSVSVNTEIIDILAVGTVSFVLTFSGEWIWSQHTTTTYLLNYVYIDEYDTSNNRIRQWDYRDDPFTTDTLYNSDDFNPPPILFTGNFAESLVDLDSDGLNDIFSIEVEIEVTEANLPYSVYVYGYITIDGDNWQASQWVDMNSLTLGINTVELRWFTIEMYLTLKDQTYNVDFYIERTDTWIRLDTYLDYVTSTYTYTQFDPPSIEFTENFFDNGVDTDIPSNSRFDYVELTFEVNVFEAGKYRLYGWLYADEGGNSYYFETTDGWMDLSTGLHNIIVEVDYFWFLGHSSGALIYFDSVYLHRYFDNYGDVQMDHYSDRHYISTYYHSEFEIPPIAFSDNISYDYGVDTDASGRFDYLELVIEVNVTETGTFWFYGYVYCDSGGNSFHFNSGQMSLGIGLHNVSFQIEIAWVRSHQDGSAFYIGELYLYEYIPAEGDRQRGYLSTSRYFSRIYYHNDFDPPDAFVTRVVEFNPIDFNSDGLYDVYRVVYEVNVTVPSLDLHIHSVLEEQNTWNYITSTSIELYDLPFGMHNISIDFRGNEIYSSWFTQGLQLSSYELTRISDWTRVDEFYGPIPLTILYTYEDFNPEYFPLISIYHLNVIENQFDQVEINATILRYSSESVDSVELETEYGWYTMSRIFMGGNFEIWTYTYSPSSIDTYHFIVHAYGNWGSEDSMIYQTGGPAFIGFQVNTTRGSVGDGFLFSARVNDSDGIDNIILHLGDTDYPMSFISSEPDYELWQVSVTIDQAGTVTAYATATDGIGISSNSYEIALDIDAGEPEIRSFTMNTTLPITLGGVIHFEALVRDPDGISEVILVTMGTEYAMNFVVSSPLGELWDLEVTFYQAGELTAYIIVKDVYGVSSQSDSLDIIVNEGSVIQDVDISPGTEVKIDEEITFTIEIQKSDAIITSVTLEIEDDQGNDYLVPLEMIDETEDLEIYGGSYTPEHSGTFECTIRVLNTKNQESIYKVTIKVRSEQNITGAPGFELAVALGILVLLPLTRKRWKIKK
ncbi:MAG: hypothetical protein ACFFDC_09815 [Promethearchaeota archaeon]